MPAKLLLAFLFSITALAQNPHLRITPGALNSAGAAVSGASLCTEQDTCFQMPSYQRGEVPCPLAFDPAASVLAHSFILFTSLCNAGNEGFFQHFAILRSDEHRLVNLLPDLTLSGDSDFAIWNEPQISRYPLFIAAETIFTNDESHLAPHRINVMVYSYDPAQSQYRQLLQYETSKSNPIRTRGTTHFIPTERSEILRHLSQL